MASTRHSPPQHPTIGSSPIPWFIAPLNGFPLFYGPSLTILTPREPLFGICLCDVCFIGSCSAMENKFPHIAPNSHYVWSSFWCNLESLCDDVNGWWLTITLYAPPYIRWSRKEISLEKINNPQMSRWVCRNGSELVRRRNIFLSTGGRVAANSDMIIIGN